MVRHEVEKRRVFDGMARGTETLPSPDAYDEPDQHCKETDGVADGDTTDDPVGRP